MKISNPIVNGWINLKIKSIQLLTPQIKYYKYYNFKTENEEKNDSQISDCEEYFTHFYINKS